MDIQPLKRSRRAFWLTSPEWGVRGSPSFTHASYFSKAVTMSLKSGRFDGFFSQQRFTRCASAGCQLGANGGRSFCQKAKINSTINKREDHKMHFRVVYTEAAKINRGRC